MRLPSKRTRKIYVFTIVFTTIVGFYCGKTTLESGVLQFQNKENGRHEKLFRSSRNADVGVNENVTPDQTQGPSVQSLITPKPLSNTIQTQTNRTANITKLQDIFLSVKSTLDNHQLRLQLLLETWISTARNQTYIFTDGEDEVLKQKLPANHVINTKCSKNHYRTSLVCKMGHEFDLFIVSGLRWFCHVDDDTYVNVDQLVKVLQTYNHTSDWYLGRPSLSHPIEMPDHDQPGQNIAFWFATGGAGFCISRSLALKMVPYAGGGRLARAADHIRLPDDCTIGYIINSILHKDLTVIKLFHSHLEALWRIKAPDLKNQITFSYLLRPERTNIVNVPGFPTDQDPTRFWSIHCHIHPLSKECLSRKS